MDATRGPGRVIDRGTVHVFTYKDGLLARLAHDLRLSLGRFEVRVEGEAVTARFWPETLTVDGTMRDGRLDAGELSASDRQKIHGNITDEILLTARWPVVTFTGKATVGEGRHTVSGELEMKGRKVPLTVQVREEEGRYRSEVRLEPSRWGIPPYKALAGAIKLQDRIDLRFDLVKP